MRASALIALLLVPGALAAQPATRSRGPLPTADGVRSGLVRYVPAGGPGRGTVVLLPDLGTSWHLYDLDGGGLAPALARDGWQVLVPEWRGTGGAEVPYGGYVLEDLLDGEAEAAFAEAARAPGRVVLGGAGLGATLALVLAARHPARVSAVLAFQPLVAPDSPGGPEASVLARLEEAPPWLDLVALTRERMHGQRTWFEVLFANDGSLDEGTMRSARLHVLAPVHRRVVRQLAEAVRTRELLLGGVPVVERLRGWTGPTVLVFAPRDNWIHPEWAVPVRDVLGHERCRVHVLDVLAGLRQDHGHLGMLLGRHVDEEVFKPVLRDLAELTR